MGLRIAGTRLEPIIREFEGELEAMGLTKLRPRFYLSTEWGVAFGSISIALPFYLAKPELEELQAQHIGHIEGVSKAEILRYLRHEMGHVVNYAFKLYEQQDWVKLFGSITQPYIEEYHPQPFSRRFVRHLPGWYAQKHPDEDWAETFAVWMTPGSDWRKEYDSWPSARAKLEYCDRIVNEIRDREPAVKVEERDEDVGELTYSLHDYFDRMRLGSDNPPPGLEGALTAIFEDVGQPEAPDVLAPVSSGARPEVPRKPAAVLIRKMERDLVANVYRWTGHFPERTRPLVRYLADKSEELKQVYPADREHAVATAITTLVTALAMNHVHRGTYLP